MKEKSRDHLRFFCGMYKTIKDVQGLHKINFLYMSNMIISNKCIICKVDIYKIIDKLSKKKST